MARVYEKSGGSRSRKGILNKSRQEDVNVWKVCSNMTVVSLRHLSEQIPPASSAKLFSKECFGVMFQVDFLARMRRKNEKIRILHLPLKLMA